MVVNFKHGKLTCCDTDKAVARVEKGFGNTRVNDRTRRWYSLSQAIEEDKAVRWQSDLGGSDEFEVLSLAVCPDSVVAIAKFKQRTRAWGQTHVVCLDKQTGRVRFQRPLTDDPLPGGLLVDAKGQIVVTMLNGNVVCLSARS